MSEKKTPMKVKLTDRTLWSHYLAVLGVLSSLLSFVTMFVAPADLVPNVWYIAGPFIGLMVALFLGMWIYANSTKRLDLSINNTNITVKEGNIFELYDKAPEDRKGEVTVIAVNDFFDTIVDNKVIAEKSLHGMYVRKVRADGKLEALKETIKKVVDVPENQVGPEKKQRGANSEEVTLMRCKLGTLVEYESYVLAAFSWFNEKDEAHLTGEQYLDFWMQFWKNISTIYAGRTINIPLMGAGITRFDDRVPSKQELLEYMLWTMKLSGFGIKYSNVRINFIIYSDDLPEIDLYHIKHNPNFK